MQVAILLNDSWVPLFGILFLFLAFFLLVIILSLIGRATNTTFVYKTTVIEPFKTPKEIKEERIKSEIKNKRNEWVDELNRFCSEFSFCDFLNKSKDESEESKHLNHIRMLYSDFGLKKPSTSAWSVTGTESYLSEASSIIVSNGKADEVLAEYKKLKELHEKKEISDTEYYKLGNALYNKSIN